MPSYKAVLFAPDGDWTTDYSGSDSVEAVEALLADQGSRWYFYPFHAVIRDKGALTRSSQRIVADLTPFGDMERRTIRTFSRMLADLPDDVLESVLW